MSGFVPESLAENRFSLFCMNSNQSGLREGPWGVPTSGLIMLLLPFSSTPITLNLVRVISFPIFTS